VLEVLVVLLDLVLEVAKQFMEWYLQVGEVLLVPLEW
jgi:hypothetical protein